ncbi:O-antigen ligase family protein [Blastococcus saxobsidens]|uniref:O-antigen ligase-related domain-containing protein n=1 Tax=Blastococcus saxobsidens (strain DD2) TaxID=1146883 RepID=H6RMZ4_BLASD|nr:O-antigen ligase family protein [Blastococcus saxobsidens]CCG01347.1 conserved membrane protein of unknown function [Blastococcus saxobsidens DD2]
MIRARLADMVGAGLLLLVAGAALVSAEVTGAGNPWPVVATLIGAGVAYAAGRVLVPVLRPVVAVVLCGVVAVLLLDPAALSGGPLVPPLGYANANAALYVQVAALTGLAALTAGDDRPPGLTVLPVGGLVAVTGLTGSLAGLTTGAVVLVVFLALLAGWRPGRRRWLLGCLATVLAAHLTVLALGATYRPDDAPTAQVAAASALSERRLALWHDAVSLTADHPFTGVSPGEFPRASPMARLDPDTRQAHSATLQTAAETGWLGGAALLCLLLWAVSRPLLGAGRPGATAVVGATSATALAVHAAVDYVLAFPLVLTTAALVLGAATAHLWTAPATAMRRSTDERPSR